MGKAALEGQPGVSSVESGWYRFKEVNRVIYDPQIITVKKMEQLLTKTGTYVKTVEE